MQPRARFHSEELQESWIEGDKGAAWREETIVALAGTARVVAVYASPDVVTTYEKPVQPAGERSRRPFG